MTDSERAVAETGCCGALWAAEAATTGSSALPSVVLTTSKMLGGLTAFGDDCAVPWCSSSDRVEADGARAGAACPGDAGADGTNDDDSVRDTLT